MPENTTLTKAEIEQLIEEVVRKTELVRAGYSLRKWFTVSEVATMFGKSISWVDKKIVDGYFEISKKKGSLKMISKRSIENFK